MSRPTAYRPQAARELFTPEPWADERISGSDRSDVRPRTIYGDRETCNDLEWASLSSRMPAHQLFQFGEDCDAPRAPP